MHFHSTNYVTKQTSFTSFKPFNVVVKLRVEANRYNQQLHYIVTVVRVLNRLSGNTTTTHRVITYNLHNITVLSTSHHPVTQLSYTTTVVHCCTIENKYSLIGPVLSVLCYPILPVSDSCSVCNIAAVPCSGWLSDIALLLLYSYSQLLKISQCSTKLNSKPTI